MDRRAKRRTVVKGAIAVIAGGVAGQLRQLPDFFGIGNSRVAASKPDG